MRIAVCPDSYFAVHAIRRDHFEAAVYHAGRVVVVLIANGVDQRPFKSVSNLHLQRRGVHLPSGLRCALFGSVEWEEALERLGDIPKAELFDQEHTYRLRPKRDR